jgi:hypothetical protein
MTEGAFFQISPVTGFYVPCHTTAWQGAFQGRTGEKTLKIRTLSIHFFAYIYTPENVLFKIPMPFPCSFSGNLGISGIHYRGVRCRKSGSD